MHGYALVFSITSRETFERIEPINEALLNALGDAQDVPRVLVGSMKDLSHQRQVSMQVRRMSDVVGYVGILVGIQKKWSQRLVCPLPPFGSLALILYTVSAAPIP